MQQEGECQEHSSSNKKQDPATAKEQCVKTACDPRNQAEVDLMVEESKKGILMLWVWM